MIILAISILICVLSALIAEKKESVVAVAVALVIFFFSLVFGVFSLVGLIATMPVFELQEKIELEETYTTLDCLLKSDKNNCIVLSKEISEYNTSVKQGRELLNNFWFKDYQYKFWNEMPLIELEDYE